MDLDHSNMVVIDCDSEVSVNYFKDLADTTEAWINEDQSSMHLVFKADSYTGVVKSLRSTSFRSAPNVPP